MVNETDPLLRDHETGLVPIQSQKPSTHQIKFSTEIVRNIKATVPLTITFFLQYLLPVTNMYATGKLGDKELASATLATSFFTITGLGMYQGLSSCLDSMCSQAYGAGNLREVGLFFQRCSVIGGIMTIPLAALWWNASHILGFIVDDVEVLKLSQIYLKIVSIGAPGLLLFETSKRYLQGQHIYNAGGYILVSVTLCNIVLNWVLVINPYTSIGFIGAPICMVMVYWLQPLLVLAYVMFIDGKQCWPGINYKECFNHWKPLLSLAIPGIIMTEAEYLACQVINILSASLGRNELTAQSITSNIGFLSFQVSLSLGVALGTEMGYFVGNEDVLGCKMLVKVSLLLGGLMSIFNSSFITYNRRFLANLFTNSEEVLNITDTTLKLSAFNQISDIMNVVAVGLLRGQGRQKLGSILTLMAYYLVSFPVGYYFGYVKSMGLFGYWYGYISGVVVLAVSEVGIILNSNWTKIFNESARRRE